MKLATDTFADSPRAKTILELLQKDLDGSSQGSSLLNPQATAPLTEGQQLVQQPCSQLLRECGLNVVAVARPLLSCAGLGYNLVMIGRCALLGAVAGPWGALAAGATCGIQRAPQLTVGALNCVNGAEQLYNNGRQMLDNTTSSCSQAGSGCGGGGAPAATSSVAPRL
jgi:hypothetical protein